MRVALLFLSEAPKPWTQTLSGGLAPPWRVVNVAIHPVDFGPLLDRNRPQVEATRILGLMPQPEAGLFRVALVGVDLYLSPLAWVCGIAPVGSGRGVVSWARLAQGRSPDSPRATERVIKEIVHELGHAAGLTHCPVPDCVMHASLLPEEIDLKSAEYCPPCLSALQTLFAR